MHDHINHMKSNPNNPGECCAVVHAAFEDINQSVECDCNCHSSAPKDTQSTSTIRKSRTVAPPPTGAQEWEKEFDKQFGFLEMTGDNIKDFIREAITAAEERGAAKKGEANRISYIQGFEEGQNATIYAMDEAAKTHWFDAGAAAHHKKVVEEIMRIAELYREANFGLDDEILRHLLAALTTIDPEKK